MSSRLRSRLVWQSPRAPEAAEGFPFAKGAPPAVETPGFDMPLAPHDIAIGLLHIGAEVEHALMAQYLYAGFSLSESQPDEEKRRAVQRWRSVVLEIAREEMGHLATVQNVLTVIGGALCFERDDYPIEDANLWPFPFELERLTKVSLGKYVLAEMPSEDALAKLGLTKEIEEIKRKLNVENIEVHRVGRIYDRVTEMFTAGPMVEGPPVADFTKTHPFIATADIQASSLKFQVSPSAWGLGYPQILIATAHDRDSALKAVDLISVQGEGSTVEADLLKSHFGRFLSIYREFPEEGEWQPSRNVARNPTTNPDIKDPARRLEGEACVWASLCNLRYRMILMYLKHSFYIEAPADYPSRSPCGSLVSWAFGEMYNIRSLSETLMSLPRAPGSPVLAGPPFEMPYSLALPARNADRWRLHRDLLTASIELVTGMIKSAVSHGDQSHVRYLQALVTTDQTALDQVTAVIGA
jgi:hypothetical protein